MLEYILFPFHFASFDVHLNRSYIAHVDDMIDA